MTDPLWGPVSYPTPVIVAMTDSFSSFAQSLEQGTAQMDDLYWWSVAYGPFSWRMFYQWWIARRWVMPRDVRKQ